MKRILFVFIALLVLFNTVSFAQGTSVDNAAQLYKEGAYTKALDVYLDVYKKTPKVTDVLYNIGNVYFRLNQLGESICFYKRAEKYSCRDKDIVGNLKIARSKILDKAGENKGSSFLSNFNFMTFFTMNEVMIGFVVCFSVFSVMILLWVLKKRGEFFKNIFFVILVLFLIYVVFMGLKVRQEFFIKEGVIISNKVEVKTGPSETLSTLFFIHEGIEFRLIKHLGKWSEVRFQNGFIGWVNEKDYWLF
jgi:hypothetical protein